MKKPIIALDPDMPERMSYLGIIEDRHDKRAALLARQHEDGYVRLYTLPRPALDDLMKHESYGIRPEAFTDFKIDKPFVHSQALVDFEINAPAITRARRELVIADMPGSHVKPKFILEDNLALHHVDHTVTLAVPTNQPCVYIATHSISGGNENQKVPFVLYHPESGMYHLLPSAKLVM